MSGSDSCQPPLAAVMCRDVWGWHKGHKSHEVRLFGDRQLTAHFHPNWSNGTAGVRGTQPLNRGSASKFYWEIKVTDRIFGTSMMFGLATKRCRLHAESFVNMIGEDDQGWGLSHKGLLWHNGQWVTFTKPFPENMATVIGLSLDTVQGTLTYYKDGVCLGVAFTGLNHIKRKLYPMVCSTAAKTEMTISNQRRDYYDLQDRCRNVILSNLPNMQDVHKLQLPILLERYLLQDYQLDTESSDDESDQSDDEMDSSTTTSKPLPYTNIANGVCNPFHRTANPEVPPFPQF